MSDLRDRYRQNKASAPLARPTPLPADISPHKTAMERVQQGTYPQTPQTVEPQITAQPQPQQPPEAPVEPSEPVLEAEQSEALAPSKRQAKKAQKAQKKADRRARKQARPKRGKAKKIVLITLLLVLLAGLGISGAYGYQHVKALGIPPSYVKTSGFPIYYPVDLPDGYYVDTNSFNTQDNALVFTIRNSSDAKKTVAVSEQKIPENFNPDKQLPDPPADVISGEQGTYTTLAGKGAIGPFNGRQVATLATSKTWIIMDVTDIPSGDIAGIASSFERVQTLPYLTNKRVYIIKNT